MLIHLAEVNRALWEQHLEIENMTAVQKLMSVVSAHFHPDACSRRKLAVWFTFFGESKYRAVYRDKMAGIDSERRRETEILLRVIIAEGGYQSLDPVMLSKNLDALYDGLWLNILIYPDTYSANGARQQISDYLATFFPQHFSIVHPA